MQLSRRDFLKLSAPAICLPVIGGVPISEKSLAKTCQPRSRKSGEKAMLYDASKCVGCHICETACRKQNELPWESNPRDLSTSTWTVVRLKEVDTSGNKEWLFWKLQCMHCTEATCVKVCPTGALRHHELGFIEYDKDKCCGCGYCVEFCPFQVPRLSGSKITGIEKMDKCIFCAERVTNNQQPACVEACPEDALTFGDRDQLVEKGRQRVEVLRETHPNAVLYGENELGGLRVMHILPEPVSFYGLPEDPRVPLAATVWQDVTKPVGFALGGLTIVVLAVNYLIARKAKLTRELDGKKKE